MYDGRCSVFSVPAGTGSGTKRVRHSDTENLMSIFQHKCTIVPDTKIHVKKAYKCSTYNEYEYRSTTHYSDVIKFPVSQRLNPLTSWHTPSTGAIVFRRYITHTVLAPSCVCSHQHYLECSKVASGPAPLKCEKWGAVNPNKQYRCHQIKFDHRKGMLDVGALNRPLLLQIPRGDDR